MGNNDKLSSTTLWKKGMSKLLIQWLSPDKLTPYEHNPKAHPAAQIEKIARAIAEVGFDQPIVADENLLVIKG
ncbi:MAG: ParB N-terminal domain-containing protein, partial [Symploca sp. SIO2E6]|nr:ParB N-terminal domain-containing protein [Symploca sp. SIO2E6]